MFKWLSRPKPPTDWDNRLAAVERKQRELEADWDEWYDKYRRLYARLSKRVSDARRAEDGPESTNGSEPAHTPNPLAIELLRGAHGVLPRR